MIPTKMRGGVEESMPIFVALHTYKMEDMMKNMEAMMNLYRAAAAGELPANLCSTYSDGIGRAWCIWEAESEEAVKKALAPVKKYMTVEVVPVMQMYPPGPDLYTLLSMVPQFKDLLP